MFELVERIFIEEDKIIKRFKTLEEAIEIFNELSNRYINVLYDVNINECDETDGYILLEHIEHKFGLIKLGIRGVKE